MKLSFLDRLLAGLGAFLDRRFGWDRLPRWLGIVTLVGLRTTLRQKNLYDTGVREVHGPRLPVS